MNLSFAALAAFLACLPVAQQAFAMSGSSSAPAEAQPPALRVIADVMIDGRGPFHFLFDTGATQAVIADATVTRLGLHAQAHRRVRVQGVNGRILAPEVHIDSLVLGALRWRDIELPMLSGPLFDGLDGIIGAQDLSGMKVSVDLLARHCVIATSPVGAADDANDMALQLLSRTLPMVSATLAGTTVQVIIDTGATETLGNPALLTALQSVDALKALHSMPPVWDVTAARQTGLTGLTPPLHLADVTLQPPAVTFGDYAVFRRWQLSDHPALLLGMDSLATLARFSIDYGRLQLRLHPRVSAVLSWHGQPQAPAPQS